MIVLAAIGSESVSINKCCPQGQYFTENLECIEASEPNIEFSSYVKNFELNYGVMPCSVVDDQWEIEKSFVLSNDGSLLLDGNVTYSKNSYCLDTVLANDTITIICPCIEKMCMWKCCSPGKQLVIDSVRGNNDCEDQLGLEDFNHNLLNGNKVNRDHVIAYGYQDCDKQRLYLESYYLLKEDGSLWTESHGIVEAGDFCGEYAVVDNNTREVRILACLGPPISKSSLVLGSLTILGMFILILTIVIQLILPDNPWLWTRMLIMHLVTMTVAYLALVLSTLITFRPFSSSCLTVGMLFSLKYTSSNNVL